MSTSKPTLVGRGYLTPFLLITILFFLWGFARSFLDVLNKHFQEMLHLTLTESSLVQAAVYLAYGLMAIPAGLFITRWGYRRGVVFGLLLFTIGALGFIPCEAIGAFAPYLFALFILGCGLAFLETAANPYSSSLGDAATASSRLNLSQSLNGLGCILGPMLGSYMLFEQKSGLVLPYGLMGAVVLLVCLAFVRFPLPELQSDCAAMSAHPESLFSVWRNPTFVLGLTALFIYEIAEIAINSLFVNYMTDVHHYPKMQAAHLLSQGGLLVFMLARVVGSLLMRRIPSARYLFGCALGAVVATLGVMLGSFGVALASLLLIYAFEAVMFPTIFALSLKGCTARQVKHASSFMMMTPIGGALGTYLMAHVAEQAGFSVAFLVPFAAFLFILGYTLLLLICKS